MELYTMLRQIADSWFMLVMFGFFVGVVAYAARSGNRRSHADAAAIPFRHEDTPAADGQDDIQPDRKNRP